MEVGGFDEPTGSFQVGNPILLNSRVLRVMKGSTQFQTHPWTGWRPFRFAINYDNFEAALQALKIANPTFKGSADPRDYALVEWHLNAEIQFASGPAKLGWSMRNAQIVLCTIERDETCSH